MIKHGLYYRPDAHGYTGHLSEAWKVTHEVAKRHEYLRGDDQVTIKEVGSINYTTDSAAAMLVLEKCCQKHGLCGIVKVAYSAGFPQPWCCESEKADTLPIAICLFAKRLFTQPAVSSATKTN